MSEQIKEEWRRLEGFVWGYEVSNLGRVKSLNYRKTGKPKIMKQSKVADGYLAVRLKKEGKPMLYRVHRLVAMVFIPNPYNHPQINHKDENKTNNRVENLEWCTAKYNINYGSLIQKISKVVYQYDKNLNLIHVWNSTMDAQRNGFHNTNVSKCCAGKLKTYKGFIWSYKKL